MINKPIMVEALAVIKLQEYAKLLKNTSFAVFFLCNPDSITIYSTGDCLYSTINRIIVPNDIGLDGIMSFPMTVFNEFCKNLILPSIPVLIGEDKMQIADNPSCSIPFWDSLARDFLIRLNRLENQLSNLRDNLFCVNLTKEVCISIKEKLLGMKASMPSEIICINNTYFITIFAGMLPVNKADDLNIVLMDTGTWYMMEYIVTKKKCPYPISVFYKYMRV